MEAKADVTEELGSEVHVIFTIDTPPVVTEQCMATMAREDEDFIPMVEAAVTTTCTARVDPRTSARPSQTVRRSVYPEHCHSSDRDLGAAIGLPAAVGSV